MNICVIGGSGFIGTRLCRRLKNVSTSFEIIDLSKSRSFPERTHIADIRDQNILEHKVKGDVIIHLAAVHRDDVRPLSLYHDTNVQGTQNLCDLATKNGIDKIVFTSTVAVYGFTAPETGEDGDIRPFNEYGRTKYAAEQVLRKWQAERPSIRSLVIVRPTVVFGEGNRGNVYNLLRTIHSGAFVMFGKGNNIKSMAYVENIAAFLEYSVAMAPGVHTYNYVDKTDFTMNALVSSVRKQLKGRNNVGLRLPLWFGMTLGYIADGIAWITGKTLPVSSIRVQKFTSTTSFTSSAHDVDGFIAPVPLREGLKRTIKAEFLQHDPNAEKFVTE